MGHNILITGGSGYLGGTLLAEWKNANISGYDKLFAMIRSDEQAEAVKTLYSAEPVKCSLQPDDIKHLLLENQINIVFYLIDAYKAESQVPFIQALSEVKNQTGQEVHFIYVCLHHLESSRPAAANLLRQREQSISRIWQASTPTRLSLIPSHLSMTFKKTKPESPSKTPRAPTKH